MIFMHPIIIDDFNFDVFTVKIMSENQFNSK